MPLVRLPGLGPAQILPAGCAATLSRPATVGTPLFWALCGYLLAQAYMIPVLPIGPWPIWPALADFAAVFLVGVLCFEYRRLPPLSPANRTIGQLLLIVIVGWTISFGYFMATTETTLSALLNGGFEILRIVEFACIFVAVARTPLNATRIAIMRRIVDAVIASITVSLALIYFAILPLSTLTRHLPQSQSVAGPWAAYAARERIGLTSEGLSTVGYNHAYVGVQLLALVALRLHLAGPKRSISNSFFLLLAIVGCFLSASRNGLLVILIFAATYWLRRPQQLVLLGVVGVALWLALPSFGIQFADRSLTTITERQRSLLAATDPNNLSGRDLIWQEKIAYLDEQPLRWLIGGGLGVQTTPGLMQNAHLLYLQIVVDTGLLGLVVFLLIVITVLVNLWWSEAQPRAIFWVSVALLISSLTQETFYPVSAQGHFLGFYLCCLALALGQTPETTSAPGSVAASAPATRHRTRAYRSRFALRPFSVAAEEQ